MARTHRTPPPARPAGPARRPDGWPRASRASPSTELALRMRCSKTTLYALADSKQGLVVEVVKQYFRTAVDRGSRTGWRPGTGHRAEQVAAYLAGVADQLQPLSRAFITDVAAFGPTRQTYRDNAVAAAGRVRTLLEEAAAARAIATVDATFVATWVGADDRGDPARGVRRAGGAGATPRRSAS